MKAAWLVAGRKRRAAVVLSVGVLMVGCAPEQPADENLERAILDGASGDGISILKRTGITGDMLCVVGPYTGPEAFREVTGVDWSGIEHTGLPMSDVFDVVVVIRDDEVVAWADVERGKAPEVVGVEDGCVR